MAARVIRMYRGRKRATDSDGHHGSNYRWQVDDFLVAVVDMDDNGRRIYSILLKESDYTGLIAEWTTGSATTIAENAVETEIAALVEGTDVHDMMTSTQKANLIRKSVAWP